MVEVVKTEVYHNYLVVTYQDGDEFFSNLVALHPQQFDAYAAVIEAEAKAKRMVDDLAPLSGHKPIRITERRHGMPPKK